MLTAVFYGYISSYYVIIYTYCHSLFLFSPMEENRVRHVIKNYERTTIFCHFAL